MKSTALRAALLTAMFAVPLATFAQYSQQGSSGATTAAPGTPAATPQAGLEGARSKHCDTMTGAERDQCLKDEAAKTESKGPSDSAATGASAPSNTSGSGNAIQAPAAQEKPAKELVYRQPTG